eukprot:TRINITY_DN1714_c0_g1_i7.p2 TRINITY_DN1714_c0_g1~~TRINITY_DN1714_c0_g1_i7.p2  ORF type:complete len:105 (+),score=22.12 TRINITY_DN1714_c0_g1_i7:851-1165(+)
MGLPKMSNSSGFVFGFSCFSGTGAAVGAGVDCKGLPKMSNSEDAGCGCDCDCGWDFGFAGSVENKEDDSIGSEKRDWKPVLPCRFEVSSGSAKEKSGFSTGSSI